MGDRLVRFTNYFSKPWRIMAFQPVLHFFIFGATVRLWIDQTEPPNFKERISENFYGIWLFLGVFAPILSFVAYLLIKKINRYSCSFIGLWVRLAGNLGIFTVLLTYHVATTVGEIRTETMIFNRYLVGSLIFFSAVLVFRDVSTLVITEKLATQLHSTDNRKNE